MQIKNIPKLAFSIIICEAAGFIGSFFTAPSIGTWYSQLNKPAFNPPDWIFFPVWTILYLLMGISLYLILEKPLNNESKLAIGIFGIQLALNILWTIIFFGLHQPSAAFIEIIILLASILLTILAFYRLSKPAAYLLIPYLFWVCFAAVLNYYIMVLN